VSIGFTLTDLDRAIIIAVGKTGGLKMSRIHELYGVDAEDRVHLLVQHGVLYVDLDMKLQCGDVA
jgi:hypothetical protein